MSDRIHRPLAWFIAALMVTAAAAAPTVAQVVDPDAERVYEVTANADTVDGFSAIGATANKALRAKKLVATNQYGQLPSNIIRPRWRDLKGVPAGFKDGVDDVGYLVEQIDCGATIPMDGTQWVAFWNHPRNIANQFSVIPTSGNGWMAIEIVESQLAPDNTMTTYVQVKNHGAMDPSGTTCKVVRTSFFEGMTLATAKRQLSSVKVTYPKKRP